MNIDLAKIDADIAASLPGHVQTQTAKAEAKVANFGSISLPSIGTIEETKASLCVLWPQVRDTINMALGLISWFMPTQVATVKAVIAALDKNIIAPVCAAK